MNGIIRVDYPLTMKLLPFTPAGKAFVLGLDGTLVTHDGRYGPGSFVWFPEGPEMQHGATAEEDVTVLFITNKPFDIHYR